MDLQKQGVIYLYFISSILTTLLNKEIVYRLKFSQHYLLIIMQSIIIVSLSYLVIIIKGMDIKIKNIKEWMVTSGVLSLMIVSNVKAVYYFEISLYTLYKNCTIVLVACLERIFYDKTISWLGYFTFSLIILSTWTADFSKTKNVLGCLWMLLNISSTAGFAMYLKALMNRNRSKIESVFFTNFIVIFFLTPMSFLFDDYSTKVPMDLRLVFLIVISSVLAMTTAFSTAWVLKTVTSTGFCMLGASNKLMLSICGLFWFNEDKGVLKIASLLLGIFSGLAYSYETATVK